MVNNCDNCWRMKQALEDILDGYNTPSFPQLLLNADRILGIIKQKEEAFESRGIS